MTNVLKLYKMFFSGLNDTAHILGQVIYKLFSGKVGWLKAFLLSTVVVSVFLISFNIIEIFIKAQDRGTLTSFSQGALQQIIILGASNGGRDIITIILWGSTIAAFVLPIVSNALLSSYSKSSMIGLKRNDIHQITDSVVLQYSSILTLMQLVGMILFFSVIKYAYNLTATIYIIPLLLWICFGMLTVLLAWFMDFLLRKYGPNFKFSFVLLMSGVLAYLFFLVPYISKNYFGLADVIYESFTNIGKLFTVAFILLAISASLIYGIMYFGIITINTTAPYTTIKRDKKYNFVGSLRLTYRVLFRNGNVKVPVFMMVIVILSSIIMTGNSPTLFAFIFALPMVVTMSFMINIYGVTGYGNSWLFSIKGFREKSLMFFAFVNLSIIALSVGFVSAAAVMLNILPAYDGARFLVASMMATTIMTGISSAYAMFQPNKYDVHVRGENILPPSKSLLVLAVLIIVGGLPAIYTFGFANLTVLSIVTMATFIAMIITVKVLSVKMREGLLVNEIVGKTN